MSNGLMDVDPLSHYEYPSYDINPMPYQTSLPYSCIKLEERTPYNYNNASQNTYNTVNEPINNQSIVNNNQSSDINNLTAHNDGKKNVKTRKNKSNYCSEKIADANFAFYGCSVCNISYTALLDLDQHVVIHKDRMTSYRLRLKNQIKKKQMKKEKKKMKKLLKIKKETDLDVEIKPEDGYIGNEKACEYLSKEPDRNSDNLNNKEIINNSHCSLTQNSTLTNGLMKTDTTSNIQNNGNLLLKSKDKENSNDANSSNKDNNSNKDDSSNNDSSSNNNGDREAMELNNLEKIYKCFACKKQFTLSYYLKLHVRSHTDEKPYTCSVCGQSFITASKLGRHNKRIHLAERYQCRICFKVFSRFELLTNHFDKKHPDDKLEGEPYDYNAILPYLKELEEQLANQNLKDDKLKAEDLWWIDGNAPSANGNVASTEGPAPSVQTEDKNLDQPNLKIAAEELKLDFNDDIKVKKEISDNEESPGGDGITGEPGDPENDDDDVKDEPFKDDSNSDEDYFPSKTWLSSPKMDPSPPPPHRRRPATLVCEVCNKRVSSASYLRVHMRTHTGERPFKCWRCGRGFITSSKMHRHVLTHDDTDGADEVKTEDGVVKSEAEDRPDNGKPTRKTKKSSKKKMKSKFSKKIKQEGEKREKKYQKRPHACEFCHQKFLHLEMLQVHKKSHEGETLVLKCHYCLTEIESEEALKEHEATHTGPKPYQCTICGKCYKKRETMVYHKKHHKPDREFVCDICSKRFNASCKLQKHMQTHRADKFVLRYECPVCAHMFNTKYHVQMHLATHLKEGLIVEQNRNEILAMVLQNARKIPKHPNSNASLTDMMPTDERSRICNICGEIFQHFYYLEEHLKSHGSRIAIEDTAKAEVKKYICEICNKAFKLHYYLKLHSFTHSKEKPFICQQCGKGFITKGKLKRHLETHTGLKKYQCHICCKFFTRPSYLRIHIRTIHGTQDYNFIRYGSQ